MAGPDPRPLSARVDAYVANLISIAEQMDTLAMQIERQHGVATPLRDGAKLYRIVADDLTKIVNGERLDPFEVRGVI